MPRKKNTTNLKIPKIEQLPSGAYHTRVLVDGRRISITKPTRNECEALYLALKCGVVQAQKKEEPPCKTLEEALTEYIDARKGFRSPSTIYGYEQNKRNTFQDMMDANIFTTTDEEWQAAIRREKLLGHSPKYIKNAWFLMAAAIDSATGHRPKVMLYPKEGKQRPYLEPEQIDTFVAAVKGQSVEIPALLCLSSLRRSEMLALKWEKVDLKKRVIYVHGAQVRGIGGMTDKQQNKSDKSRRTIPIIPPLLEALEAADHRSEYVVTMAADTVLGQLKDVCTTNGLPAVGLHGLRHSFASLAYHLQIPEMIAAEIGGWNDLSTMRRIYTHLSQADIAKRAQDFSDYFDPAKKPQQVHSLCCRE